MTKNERIEGFCTFSHLIFVPKTQIFPNFHKIVNKRELIYSFKNGWFEYL